MTKHSKIEKEARAWIGTPFHHQGRVKQIGCDCIGLVLGVLHSLGGRSREKDATGKHLLLTDFDQTNYAPDPNSARLKEMLDKHLQPIPLTKIRAGDVLLFKIIHLPQHVGLIANHPMGGLSLIHAYSRAGKVVEETLSDSWRRRVIGAYRVSTKCLEVK